MSLKLACALTLAPAMLLAQDEQQLDEVRLIDGGSYRGLIRWENAGELEIVQILRPPGKPMHLVIRPIDRRRIARVERVGDERREQLQRLVDRFRHRGRIEAGRMEDVELSRTRRGGEDAWLRRGELFDLVSDCDEEMTRRCVVRIEQIFRAYRQLLPPRASPEQKLQIVLFGTTAAYREYLDDEGLDVQAQAFFSRGRNTIVASSDLTQFAQRLAETRARHDEVRKLYAQRNVQFRDRLQQHAGELQGLGWSADRIARDLAARKAAWKKEYESVVGPGGKLQQMDRRNEARFNEVTERMFKRLYHEAFHAYFDNYVYPPDQYATPRWLHEGLAQVFENGQLDGDVLRIDAPHRESLLALQQELRKENRLTLAEVLDADDRSFLISHRDDQASKRHYLYAWGLAYWLAFEMNLLEADNLEVYLSKQSAALLPATRFEQLVDTPLGEFEKKWRDGWLQKQPPR